MSRYLNEAGALLRRALNLAPWALIGSAVATPAYAATAVAIDGLTLPVLTGSIVLLIIGLVLKATRGKIAQSTRSNGFGEGIGRYRLQLGRGDSD